MGRRMAIMRVDREVWHLMQKPFHSDQPLLEAVAEFMQFPPETKVVGISCDLYFDCDQVAIKLEHPDFADVLPGNALPEVSALYEHGLDGKPVFAGWTGPAVEYRTLRTEEAVAPIPAPMPDAPPVRFREFL